MESDPILSNFASWYENLDLYQGHFPARGTISGAIIVLESLKTNFTPEIDNFTAKGGSQIKGASGESVRKILARFGENRHFVSEGGRTNRGLRGDIINLLNIIGDADLDNLNIDIRNSYLNQMQSFLINKVNEYHNQQRIKFIYDSSKSTWQLISNLLDAAKVKGKEGPIAQYLVGAKLQLRFPNLLIDNNSFSTADQQLGRTGDFLVGNTSFHVTVSPMAPLYEKCKKNLEEGYRPFLLVSDRTAIGAKQNAETIALGQITVETIETFISQNIEELSEFSAHNVKSGLRKLLETYNERVNSVESDKSMLIDIPANI
jgi:hypothetical protein